MGSGTHCALVHFSWAHFRMVVQRDQVHLGSGVVSCALKRFGEVLALGYDLDWLI